MNEVSAATRIRAALAHTSGPRVLLSRALVSELLVAAHPGGDPSTKKVGLSDTHDDRTALARASWDTSTDGRIETYGTWEQLDEHRPDMANQQRECARRVIRHLADRG